MDFNPRGLFLKRVNVENQHTPSRFIVFKSRTNTIGRHETCDILIKGSSRIVSRKQCVMTFEENGKLYVENLSGSNFTFINEDKVISINLSIFFIN